jgi:hypothetical protein
MRSIAMNNTARIAVEKAMRQFDFVAQSYHLNNWYKDKSRQDLVDDLVLMLEHDDLEHFRLELLDAQSTVRFEFRIDFGADGQVKNLRDSAAGVEVPVMPPGLIANYRLLVNPWPPKKIDQYKHLLKRGWGTVPPFRKDAGDVIESEHARKVTGGRQKGTIFVDAAARHRLVVTQVFPTYAFGRDLTLGLDGVFLLSKYAPQGLKFHAGLILLAVVIQTPRGLQARAIQPAN